MRSKSIEQDGPPCHNALVRLYSFDLELAVDGVVEVDLLHRRPDIVDRDSSTVKQFDDLLGQTYAGSL